MNRKSNFIVGMSLWLTIFGVALMCLIVYAGVYSLLPNNLGMLIVQTLNLIILLVTLYMKLWKIADKDKNYVGTGHIEYRKYSGLEIGLVGLILPIASYILLIIGLILNSTGLVAIFRLLNVEFIGFLGVLLPLKLEEIHWYNVLLSLLPFVIIPAVCQLAYHLGYKRIYLAANIMYQKKKK